MSILIQARAAFNPNPATFDDRMVRIESEEALWDRNFARVHGRPFQVTTTPKPSPADAAYDSGYVLGEGGMEPHEVEVPGGMSRREADAFMAGVSRGAVDRWRQYMLDLAETTGPDIWGDPSQYNVGGGLVGH